jgi:hypothetical protein
MKVVVSLENGAIPPVFNLGTLNPNINFGGAKIQPVTSLATRKGTALRKLRCKRTAAWRMPQEPVHVFT